MLLSVRIDDVRDNNETEKTNIEIDTPEGRKWKEKKK